MIILPRQKRIVNRGNIIKEEMSMGLFIILSVIVATAVFIMIKCGSLSTAYDVSLTIVWVAGIGLAIVIMLLVRTAIFGSIDYEVTCENRELLVYRLEKTEENPITIGNETLFQEIKDFNKDILVARRLNNNFMTRGIINPYVAENVELIEY